MKKIKSYSRAFLFRHLQLKVFQKIADRASSYDYFVQNGLIEQKRKYSVTNCWVRVKASQFVLFRCLWYASRLQTFLPLIPLPPPHRRHIEGMLFNCFRRVISMINPNNRYKIIWDIFIYVVLLANIFYVPIDLAWPNDMRDHPWLKVALSDIPGWAFFFDIVLNFLTSFYEEGVLIKQSR